ncbi:MAG: TonB family protein [Emcibacteraceae bacterium]|nr:TonB family protein [Emcibacteraceae bacterium]MDG1859145.1 TonB family protein [Emcibacteraceae bacterium]
MFKKLLIITTLLISPAFADQAADKAEFKRLYAEFNDLYANSEDIEPVIEVAEKLYVLTPKAYGDTSNHYAVVIFNLAKLYDEKGRSFENEFEIKASKLYKEYFKIQDKRKVPKDKEYLNQYITYVNTLVNVEGYEIKTNDINKIITISEKLNLTKFEHASSIYFAATMFFGTGRNAKSKKYFKNALEIYEQELDPDHIRIAEVLFWLGKYDLADKKYESAEEKFLKIIEIFDKNNLTGNEIALSSHAFLVNIYEELGLSQKSTQHCVAIGLKRKKEFDVFEIPIYRKLPKYPFSAIHAVREAFVLVEFTVDTDGITRDIEVVESSSKSFEKTTIAAVSKYRFAPRVHDGELVNTKGVRNRIEYKILK